MYERKESEAWDSERERVSKIKVNLRFYRFLTWSSSTI